MALTEANPLSEVTFCRLGTTHKSLLQVTTKVADERVKERLKANDTALGVVFDDGTLHAGMFGLISGAEEVVGDLAIDDGTVVVIELGLDTLALDYWPKGQYQPSSTFHRCHRES